MTAQTFSRSAKSILGAALAALGLLLIFVNLDNATASFSSRFTSPAESLGAAFELSLAGLRAAQTYFFDHSKFQSGLEQILLSFWPVTLVLFGAALLQSAVGGRLVNTRARMRSQTTGVGG